MPEGFQRAWTNYVWDAGTTGVLCNPRARKRVDSRARYTGQVMRQSPAFLLLCSIGGLAIFSSTIAKNPVLPILAHELGANEGMIGWVAAASTLTGILASLPAGLLSDRWGRKRLLKDSPGYRSGSR